MEEKNLNAEVNEEAVQPQRENGAEEREEITEPQNSVDDMSDEEFESYINSAQNGTVPENQTDIRREVQAEDEQDNSDNTGTAEPAESEKKSEPFKQFATQEDYQREIDRIIGERLKKTREDTEKFEGLKELSRRFYGGEDADASIRQLIDDLRAQNAEKSGVSVEEYTRQEQDSIDARRYREEQSRQAEEQKRIGEIQRRWQKESEDLKAVVPDFDLNTALGNKTFYDNLVKGFSVSTAYLAANKAAQSAAAKPKRRPIEQVGAAKSYGGKAEANPETMSDRDFADYINRLKRSD